MERYLEKALKKDLGKKILLISGPRQVGKTTLAKGLCKTSDLEYLNYDYVPDRRRILREEWDHSASLVIFDELHKMKKWKQWVKGIYDTQQNPQALVITGSARMDTFKKVGDSLAGRYFQYHLMPLDMKELTPNRRSASLELVQKLLTLGGFPEPFLSDSESFYLRWRQTHLDIILKQDLLEMESIRRVSDLATLVELMREKIGSTLSYNSLREDLRTDDKSIKRWMLLLENSYLFFRIMPYSTKLSRSIQKAPKYYFFDVPRVEEPGARFENLVALALYKEVLFRRDVEGQDYSLHFLRDKDHKEIDFLICFKGEPVAMIETKLSDATPTPHFEHFEKRIKSSRPITKIQVLLDLKKPFTTKTGVRVVKAEEWLCRLDWQK